MESSATPAHSPTPSPEETPGFAAGLAGETPSAALRDGKLDLSGLSAPENLEEARLESFTIDGICGVY